MDKIDKLFYDILIDFIGIECRNFSGKNYVEPLTGKIWRMDCIDLTYFYLEIQRRTGIKIENKIIENGDFLYLANIKKYLKSKL